MMSRKPFEFISGLAVYFVIALLIGWAIILRLSVIPVQFITWLGQSHNPQNALAFFSLTLSATVLMFLRLGIEIPKIKIFTSSEKVQPYLSGLPIWALGMLWVGSLVGFWSVFPSCQPPVTIQFDVSGREGVFHPSDEIVVFPGEAITVTARSVNPDATLSCSWEYAGSIFETLGAQRGCQVSARFNEQPGNGFMTVSVSENFCSQSSIFSLQAIIENH
jgi:hypothetical protein